MAQTCSSLHTTTYKQNWSEEYLLSVYTASVLALLPQISSNLSGISTSWSWSTLISTYPFSSSSEFLFEVSSLTLFGIFWLHTQIRPPKTLIEPLNCHYDNAKQVPLLGDCCGRGNSNECSSDMCTVIWLNHSHFYYNHIHFYFLV